MQIINDGASYRREKKKRKIGGDKNFEREQKPLSVVGDTAERFSKNIPWENKTRWKELGIEAPITAE